MWSELYNQSNQPSLDSINAFINNELWYKLCLFIEATYSLSPKLEYSKCSMQKGWNLKYKKGGKSLCTLYPMKDYFIALVVIGEKELIESELMLPTLSDYVQRLFSETPFSLGGKWLMIEVRENAVLENVLKLIQLRVKPKK